MRYEHVLSPVSDEWFLKQKRKDEYLAQLLKPGDKVVVCKRCKRVWLSEVWQSVGNCPLNSCKCQETQQFSRKALDVKGKKGCGKIKIVGVNARSKYKPKLGDYIKYAIARSVNVINVVCYLVVFGLLGVIGYQYGKDALPEFQGQLSFPPQMSMEGAMDFTNKVNLIFQFGTIFMFICLVTLIGAVFVKTSREALKQLSIRSFICALALWIISWLIGW